MLGDNNLKFKTIFQNGKTLLILSLKKHEMVNQSLIQSLDQANYSELLSASWTNSGGHNNLTFDVSNLVCLEEYIKSDMPQEKYFNIIKQIQRIYEKCSKASMPVNNLVCNIRYAYYDLKNSKLYMVYAPVTNSKYSSNMVKFLYDLHKKSSVIISDANVIFRYKEFLETRLFMQKKSKDKNSSCSYNDIYNFLHDLCGESQNEPAAEPAHVLLKDERETDSSRYFTPSDTTSVTEAVRNTEPPKKEAVISKTIKASSLRGKKNTISEPMPFLEDSAHEKHIITSLPFSLGRDSSNNLTVANPNVSSVHAVIEKNGGKYFIKDKNSTNGTYFGDEEISYEPLTDGCTFSLYDVDFTFHMPAPEASVEPETNGKPSTTTFAVKNRKKQEDYISYIQDTSSQHNYYITGYPYTNSELQGIQIIEAQEKLWLMNESCVLLLAETEQVEQGFAFPLYSGCSFSIGQKKYTFYIKN